MQQGDKFFWNHRWTGSVDFGTGPTWSFIRKIKEVFPFIERWTWALVISSEWRSWMAYVPQKVELFKGTIRSNPDSGYGRNSL